MVLPGIPLSSSPCPPALQILRVRYTLLLSPNHLAPTTEAEQVEMVVGTFGSWSHTLELGLSLQPLWRGEKSALSGSVCMLIVSLFVGCVSE